MEMWTLAQFQLWILTACSEAGEIIAAAIHGEYVQDKIGGWIQKWTASNLFNHPPGIFAKACVDALGYVTLAGIHVDPPAMNPVTISEAEATGEADKADAALAQLAACRLMAGPAGDAFNTLSIGMMVRNPETLVKAFTILQSIFYSFCILGNTMRSKMQQGGKPAVNPGPSQHVVHTLFGDTVVDDGIDPAMKFGNLNVVDAIALLRAIVKGG